MKDYHSLFYSKVLGPLKGLQDSKKSVESLFDSGELQLSLTYEPRAESYRHNYLRNKHLSTRKRVIIGYKVGRTHEMVALLLEDKRALRVTIYKKAVEFLFPDDADNALTELKLLLEKFYDVTVEERSSLSSVDMSTGNHPDHYSLYDPTRV